MNHNKNYTLQKTNLIEGIIIVIPCFNEENYLLRTMQSLGFGKGRNSLLSNIILIIVDNNSTDSTLGIANTIQQNSPSDQVFIVIEKERGIVPARHSGNLFANRIAKSNNWDINKTLILQADADTTYSGNYIEEMKAAAEMAGQNMLIEALIDYDPISKPVIEDYIKLCHLTDNALQKFFVLKETSDVIIDDKVAGYRLSDYYNWQNGNPQEYTPIGDEVFAETTRLYLKAKAMGAKKIVVGTTKAYHSIRKILSNTTLHYITAGFPRERSFIKKWEATGEDILNLTHFTLEQSNSLELLSKIRQQHVFALFCVLPRHVNGLLEEQSTENLKEIEELISDFLPERTINDLLTQPSVFLSDVLDLITCVKPESGPYHKFLGP